ncbi:MAG TPA: 30S ribosomal protein S12 methylthiotransferase RimO [Acidimicrobiia bacterium]|nr:30S ribosomal protein S12 methylthiotransferase RimO [Acidimicrobiia bacterium]
MSAAPTVWLTTLGCAKNQVDSEKVEMMLGDAGYGVAASPESADVVMVNTCAFIEEARRESVETILEAQDRKKSGARTVVIGCMAQRFGVEVEAALPEVDAVVGLDRYGQLIATLDGLTGYGPDGAGPWEPVTVRRRPVMDILDSVNRPRPGVPYAYVKVAEGCDKPCTFCAIPLIRGKQRSRRPREIRQEIGNLTALGVREVVLVAQDLAAYGRDLGRTTGADRGAPGFVELLRSVSEVEGLDRLRLLYLYPKEIRDSLIEEMASNPVVASYFDLSLQHASGRLLRAMRRPGDGGRYRELIGRIRTASPDATLRSSFIVGFPGETVDDVEELAEFLEDVRLDWAGFFPYSAEDGTPAADLDGRIDPADVSERLRYLSGVQEEVTSQINADRVGEVIDVLVDQVEDERPVGRSVWQAPEIDGVIVLDAGTPGEWVTAEITAAIGTDLEARVVS